MDFGGNPDDIFRTGETVMGTPSRRREPPGGLSGITGHPRNTPASAGTTLPDLPFSRPFAISLRWRLVSAYRVAVSPEDCTQVCLGV